MADPDRIGKQVNVFLTPTHTERLERLRDLIGEPGKPAPVVEVVRQGLVALENTLTPPTAPLTEQAPQP